MGENPRQRERESFRLKRNVRGRQIHDSENHKQRDVERWVNKERERVSRECNEKFCVVVCCQFFVCFCSAFCCWAPIQCLLLFLYLFRCCDKNVRVFWFACTDRERMVFCLLVVFVCVCWIWMILCEHCGMQWGLHWVKDKIFVFRKHIHMEITGTRN